MENAVICTLATESCYKDLQVFMFTLELYNKPPPQVFLLCDNFIEDKIKQLNKPYIKTTASLEKYGSVNRQHMERIPGSTYKTRWEDFMMEKTTIMDIAFKANNKSVFFMDCDICFMGPLPKVQDETATLALSQHLIRPLDEMRYGVFNAGFLWTSDPKIPELWRQAATRSRYYDQAALEELEKNQKEKTYRFPKQVNYGWWRMFQGPDPHDKLQSEWTVFRGDSQSHSGIKVNAIHLQSIHTHWHELHDIPTITFNKFVISKLKTLSKGNHKNAQLFLKFLVNDLKIDI